MTDALRMERARLQLEIEDALGELQGLRRRARQFAEDAQVVLDKVLHNAALEPSEADFSQEFEDNNRVGAEYRGIFDFNTAVSTISQLKALRQRISNLQKAKRQLDLAATL